MNENLFNVKIIVLNSPHNTRYDRVYSPASIPVLAKKTISLGSRLIACCKLAQTLARQIWRHNYVINHNEYLIFYIVRIYQSLGVFTAIFV